ncbi:Acyl-CoA--sterol O-acyltransferase 1 [Bienertia sinuspersici]
MVVELAEDELANVCKLLLFHRKDYFKRFYKIISNFSCNNSLPNLPLHLTSIHFCGFTSFLISWLANFKLLLFAFGKPPLSFDPPISYHLFIAVSCLPIKIQPQKTPDQKTQIIHTHLSNPTKIGLELPNQRYPFILMIKIYEYSDQIHPKLLWLIYFFHIYFGLEITLAILAKVANSFLGILRPTVYLPTIDYFTRFIGHKSASLAAVMATFIVSAVMHELIFYYLGRVGPTFEVTWFFLLHGFCLCLEISVRSLEERESGGSHQGGCRVS